MWDRLKIRERDRRLGLLFLMTLAAVFVGSLLTMGFPLAGETAGVFILGIFWVVTVRRIVAVRQGKWGPAPMGPLSSDERSKARSKLLRGYSTSPGYRSSSFSSSSS